MALRHILTPIRLGPVEVPNRVVRTAHGTDIGRYHMSDDLIAYHLARAKGGVGLSMLETLSVHDESSPGHLSVHDPDLQAGYRRLVEAVSPYGMKVFQQVWHGGHNAHRKDKLPNLSASARPGLFDGVGAQAMRREQIEDMVDRFAETAAFVEGGGLHGVEIHGAHGYLIQQFFSPLHNRRTDEYGGSFENRIRFMLEVMRAVRGRVSANFAVGIRLSPEGMEGGTTAEECIKAVRLLEDEKLIDFVNLSLGNYYQLHKIIGAMHEPVGYELASSTPITAAARVPCIVSGRFRTLEEADQVIARGEADLVGMTRAHIADPDIVRKTREGREDEIRPCIACNQGCAGGLPEVGHLACTVNVAVGEERTLAEDLIERVQEPKHVLVIGGGPSGLEAARVAALRGHRVTLAEASPDLGGGILAAQRAPRHQTIGDIVDWLSREVYRLGVDVQLNSYMTGDDVREMNPDAVILAAGALPPEDGFQLHVPQGAPSGMNRPMVVNSLDVLRSGREPANGRAVVFDGVGHYEAIAAAEWLIQKGHHVTFVTGYGSFAPRIDYHFTNGPALERLARDGRFKLLTRYQVIAVEQDQVLVAPLYAPQQTEVLDAGLLVFVSMGVPNRDLVDELADWGRPVIPVGDAVIPRFLRQAIRDGHLAARAI